ncbi:hypothetical protein GGI09_005742 [Coemansia sp. S100]|nr:hypothetical protein LPJ71_007461 [Coemansia sp. S17]KAJ2015381.1 hypothetical protein GGI14_004313 [Coemansia sp. S680]KAJ2034517.1 hypothetical protein H4S03_004927 [Coemansia sp. S3946]KAJ2093829.1 hypothetical protein GGI09_005742 [Coemansia sp. S100]
MARNLNKPWLRELLSDSSTAFSTELKDVGRAQIFRITTEPHISCEISDGEDFIVAAFTKKAVSAFEQKHGRNLSTATGAVIHIKSCSLRYHLPHPPSSRSFCPNPDNGMCPKSLCASGHPQFWILVSGFVYVGGDGNSVFGEPVNANLRDAVSFRLKRLSDTAAKSTAAASEPDSAKRVAASTVQSLENVGPEKQARKRQKSCVSDAAPQSPSRLVAPKMSRRSSARVNALPALGDVPFVDDMKSVWECQSMWSFLAIQQASVPFMPIHGLSKPHTHPGRHQHHQQLSAKEPEQPPSSAITHVSESTARSTISQPLFLTPPPVSSEDNLNGLLVPATSGAISGSEMMSQMYGGDDNFYGGRMDTDESEEDEYDEANASHDQSAGVVRHWDQPAPFALSSSRLNS